MGQQSKTLTPNLSPRHLLGAELRRWRELRQLSTAKLSNLVYVSQDLLQKVEKAERNASMDLIRSCDDVLNTGGALGRLLDFALHQEHLPKLDPETTPIVLSVTIAAELQPLSAPLHTSTTGCPEEITYCTASDLYSRVNFRRVLPILTDSL